MTRIQCTMMITKNGGWFGLEYFAQILFSFLLILTIFSLIQNRPGQKELPIPDLEDSNRSQLQNKRNKYTAVEKIKVTSQGGTINDVTHIFSYLQGITLLVNSLKLNIYLPLIFFHSSLTSEKILYTFLTIFFLFYAHF